MVENIHKSLIELEIDLIDESINNLTNKEECDKWIDERIKYLEKRISEKPDIKPSNPNNITMKQHLINILNDLKSEPQKIVDDFIIKLENRKSKLEVIRNDSSRD